MDMIFIYFSSEDLGILLGFVLAKIMLKKNNYHSASDDGLTRLYSCEVMIVNIIIT